MDIEDALVDLGERLSATGERPLDALADGLVRQTETSEERADDVALLLLRATGRSTG